MRAWSGWRWAAFGAAAMVWALVGWPRAMAGTHGTRTAATAQQVAPGADAVLFKRVCGDCHELNAVTGTRRERQQWIDVIDEMYAEGAKATDEEFADADRIVAYRKAQGPFETFEALLKVPGINVETIQAQRHAVAL